MWPTLIFSATALIFLGMSLAALWHLRWARRLPALDTFPVSTQKPVRCSVVIAGRDEEARIVAQICGRLIGNVELRLNQRGH